MTDVRRPISLQLGATQPKSMKPSLSKTASSTPNAPTRTRTKTTTNSFDSNKRSALEPRKTLTTSASSGSLASLSSSTGSSSSSFHSSMSPLTQSVESPEPDSPSLILPYLYVGDQAQTKIDTISNLNISYILSLQSLPKFLDSDIELEESCSSDDASSTSTGRLEQTQLDETSWEAARLRETSVHSNGASKASLSSDKSTPIIKRVTSAGELEQMAIESEPQVSSSSGETSSSTVAMASEEEISSETVTKELLPTMNASKDYLVKFRSCVNRLIKGKCINISDTFEQYVERFFDETHNFIEEARRNKCNILIHCKAGISRSPTIAIAYLMKWRRLHLQDAYDFVKRCRPQISPNLNFMGQLMNYERRLLQRRLHRSPLPSPITSCLLSHSYHEQATSSSTTSMAHSEQHHQRATLAGDPRPLSRTNKTTSNEDLSCPAATSVRPVSKSRRSSPVLISPIETSSHVI